MLKNCQEEDFYGLKMVSTDRLSPDGISAFFIGTLIYSAVFTMICVSMANTSRYITNPIWPQITRYMILFLLVQVIITLFFVGIKNSFKYQKTQAVLLNIISIKVSIEMFPFYFLACEDKHAPGYMISIGLFLLAGGFIYLIISLFRAIFKVKNGMLKKGGKYLYDFSNSKLHFSVPVIYCFTIIAGFISRNLSSSGNITAEMFGIIFILILTIFIQYGIAMAWPEFFLLAYCKFRFETFNEKIPKAWLDGEVESKSLKINLSNWCTKPVLALKSCSGWKVKEKAPISVLVLIWVETSMVSYIILVLVCFYGVLIGKITMYQLLMNKLSIIILPALIVGFIINAIMIILLKFIKIVFNK